MHTISPAQLHNIIGTLPTGSSAIIDVRSPEEFNHEHIEGSINMPLDTVLEHAETLRTYQQIYLYCRSGNRSGQACVRLHNAQVAHAVSIEGGMDDMKRAGFQTVKTSNVLPMMQQVLLGAGSLVATGMMLSALVSPWFQLLPLFVSIGLIYAGLSGNCLMARVLSYMPWNRTH